MASSGTEVCWAGPGLGKGPQRRRRWAWAEEEKDADRSSTCGWGDDAQPFLGTTSPELLEDFRLAQQHGLPLEWNLDLRELGGSSGEGEADSCTLHGCPVPGVSYLPAKQGQKLNSTKSIT